MFREMVQRCQIDCAFYQSEYVTKSGTTEFHDYSFKARGYVLSLEFFFIFQVLLESDYYF